MNGSSPTTRTSAKHSNSMQPRLNSYALMAAAAGVGVAALSQPVQAKIVYTPTHHVIGKNGRYKLDLNHDKITDITLVDTSGCNTDYCYGRFSAIPAGGNGVEGKKGFLSIPFAYALKYGALVGPKQPFSGQLMASDNVGYLGQWLNVTNRYLGLKFKIKGKIHYGWARLTVTDRNTVITATLTGYAFETIANKAIIAGKTKGPHEDKIREQANSGALAAPPSQPAALSLLAMGASGLSIWRREESLATRSKTASARETL
jgi:hypothetical protein